MNLEVDNKSFLEMIYCQLHQIRYEMASINLYGNSIGDDGAKSVTTALQNINTLLALT